jgi:transcriptional regulator with XRE-family HTH domain
MPPTAAELVRRARTTARLTQRQLARRARTAQSVVARVERGLTSPSWDTLTRLLAAAGFELHADLELRPMTGAHSLDDVARILRLSPAQRLDEVGNINRFVHAARRV